MAFGLAGSAAGILLILFAIFMIFFFPNAEDHQSSHFSWLGIKIGVVSLIIGVILVFF